MSAKRTTVIDDAPGKVHKRRRAGRRPNHDGSIYQLKDGRWRGYLQVGIKSSGRPDRRYAKSSFSQDEVRQALEELKRQYADGILSNTKLTVEQYLELWLEAKAHEIKPGTLKGYRSQARLHIVPRIGRVKLAKLTALHVQKMMSEIAGEVGVRTAQLCRTEIYGALKQAVEWGLIPRNPAAAVKPIKHEHQEPKQWTVAELFIFLEAAKSHRLYSLFYLLMCSGLRRGEVLGLKWSDLVDSRLAVRRSLGPDGKLSTPKTRGSVRDIALSPDVLEVLEANRQRQAAELTELGLRPEFMFTSATGEMVMPHRLQREWEKLQKQAGVTQIRLHDLRHLHATIAAKAGLTPKMIAERLGHASPTITLNIYTHLFNEQRDESAVSVLSLIKNSEGEVN